MTSSSAFRKLVLASVLGAFAACAGPDITAPPNHSTAGDSASKLLGLFGERPKLLTCPTNETVANSAVVTALGGLVSAGGTTIEIPAGALLEDATVTVTVPASNYMEVDISVEGTDSFLFELPVTVTVSYDRCTRSNILSFPLSAWHIDSDSKTFLERMPSIDDKLTRTVTFTTGHLSGYALAN